MLLYTVDDLELAEERVARGERHVEEQEQLLILLEGAGAATEEVRESLRSYKSSLLLYRQQRDRIRAQLDAATRHDSDP